VSLDPAAGEASGPLSGIRVLELGTIVAGPFAGRLLADYGADVIKIEAPGRPDPLRDWGQQEYHGHRLWWIVHARNKRCITLDLRLPAGRELFLHLVARADVVVENFRPGTLEKWDLGYDQLRQVNEGIILAWVSGFGQTGPYRHRPGYASVTEAMGGCGPSTATRDRRRRGWRSPSATRSARCSPCRASSPRLDDIARRTCSSSRTASG
jgi:formyl-CoA transferase